MTCSEEVRSAPPSTTRGAATLVSSRRTTERCNPRLAREERLLAHALADVLRDCRMLPRSCSSQLRAAAPADSNETSWPPAELPPGGELLGPPIVLGVVVVLHCVCSGAAIDVTKDVEYWITDFDEWPLAQPVGRTSQPLTSPGSLTDTPGCPGGVRTAAPATVSPAADPAGPVPCID
jgi:hypothetical protein